tara:strand:+ start:719 stop:898 length:180 start_codon:yes stop_codon:yes gene_type:complete
MDKLTSKALELAEHVLGLCNESSHMNIFEVIILLTAVYLLYKALSILGLRKSVNISRQV